ncbi:MAG TPA: efflux RND transporter periplasmic adaptor subunit [Rhizomicrobium sp.]|nr:efflux RND transporter periplasmic adaptor subunit [Rhizomicrobium sp.]
MAHVDLYQTSKFLSLQYRTSGKALRRQITGAALFLLLGGGFALYHAKANAKVDTPAPPPPAAVSVLALKPQAVKAFAEFSGRIAAVDYAEIRPQVAGRITEIRFKDGQQVKAGDILFVIDPRPYQAAAAKAAADLQSAKVNAALAHATLARYDALRRQNAIAELTYDQSANAAKVADAAIASSAAALAQSQVDVDHAYIKAPISGRISRAEVTLGNFVGSPTQVPAVLTSIVSNDGVYADFEVDEQTYMNSVRGQKAVPVEMQVTGDSHVYRGVVESFDNHIATGSGTIRARARFTNDDGALVPGMFASVRMGAAAQNNALLVPQSAIGNDQSKRFVFVVGAGDKAEYREIALGADIDGQRVVTSGLKAGDRVILDGLQKLAPGAPVAPHDAATKTAAN